MKSQFATSSWGGRRYRVLGFTEHGAFMASNEQPSGKLRELEKSLTTLDVKTRRQFEGVYMAIRALMAPPVLKTRPIGFTADLDKE